MRAAKIGFLALSVLAAAAALGARTAQDKPAAPAATEARPKSFVRMDLLARPDRELTPPKRGIFSPSAEDEGGDAAAADAGLAAVSPAVGGEPREGGRPAAAGRAGAAEAAPGLPSLSLRYIGFVKSPRAVIGLVLVQGQALAVGTGDTVADWYKIGTITPKQIEVTGPDGSKATYPLEGEEE